MIKFLNKNKYYLISIVLLMIYSFSMIIYPFIQGEFQWKNLHDVWDHWQTFNSAMIALLASAIAIYSTVYKDKKANERALTAAKATLPFALSQILVYLKEVSRPYITEYRLMEQGNPFSRPHHSRDSFVFEEKSIEIISECIKHANKFEAKHLASILNDLQLINARFFDTFSGRRDYIIIINNIKEELMLIAKVHHKIESSFHYARGEDSISYQDPEDSSLRRILFILFEVRLSA